MSWDNIIVWMRSIQKSDGTVDSNEVEVILGTNSYTNYCS